MGGVLWARVQGLVWGMRPFVLSLRRQPHRASKKSLIPTWASVSPGSISVVASILKHGRTRVPHWYVEAPVFSAEEFGQVGRS